MEGRRTLRPAGGDHHEHERDAAVYGELPDGSLTASSATTSFAGATVTLTSFTANGGTVQFTGTVAVAFTTAGRVSGT